MLIADDTRAIKFTLSVPCYTRIQADSEILGVKMSHLIELVLCDFCEWADKISVGSKKESLESIYKLISEGGEIRFFKSIVRLLTGTGRRHSYPKSKSYTWTVTADARKALCNNDLTEKEQTSFCNDILEEYSQMNYSSREKIMLRDKIAVIERAMKHNALIKYTTSSGKEKIVAPYKIAVEPDTQYNYLIVTDEDNGGKLGSARLFSINGITELRQKKKLDAKAIEREIADRNIAYLWNDEIEIEIGLTEKGEDTYNRVIPNRPKLISKDKEKTGEYRIYRFKCTEFQAKVYFNTFGNEAEIISPDSLKKTIQEFHEKALGIDDEYPEYKKETGEN